MPRLRGSHFGHLSHVQFDNAGIDSGGLFGMPIGSKEGKMFVTNLFEIVAAKLHHSFSVLIPPVYSVTTLTS